MSQGRTWQQVVALVDGVLCLVMATACVVCGAAMAALRDSEELARQTLGQLPDTPTMREIETSGIHAYLLGIGLFLVVFGLLKAVHGVFALRASKPGRPRSLGYVVFAALFVVVSLFLVVAHVAGIAGGQPVDAGLLGTGLVSLAISVVVLVASLGVRSQEASTASTVVEPGQTAKEAAPLPRAGANEPLPQLGRAGRRGDGTTPQPSSSRTGSMPRQQVPSQTGGLPKVSSSQTGGMKRPNPSQTGGMPQPNPSQTGGMPRPNPSQTGGMPRPNPSQTGGMPRPNPSQTGGMPRPKPSQTGGMPRPNPSQTGGMPRPKPSQTGGMPRPNPSQTGGMPRSNPSQTGGMPRRGRDSGKPGKRRG